MDSKTKIPKNQNFGLSIDCYDKDNRRFSIYDLNENIDLVVMFYCI